MAAEHKTADPDSSTVCERDSFQDSFQTRVFKIIVIGDSNVGKTCLTYRFCEAKFLKNPEATIGVDFREKTLELGGENIKVRKSIIARRVVFVRYLDKEHITDSSATLAVLQRLYSAILNSRGVLYRMI